MDQQHKESKHSHIWRRMANSHNWLSIKATRRNKKNKRLIKSKHIAPVLPLNQMKLLYWCPPKLLLNKEMNRQFWLLGLLYNRLLNLMHLQLQTMKMEWKALVQAQNEVIMTALTRNLIVLLAKSLPLVPQPVAGMALTCRQGQGEEIYQRSPLSALTLQGQEDRGLLGENGPPYGLLTIKNTKHKQSLQTKVSQELLKHIYKSWLTTTLSSGTVEVLGVTEKLSNHLSQNILLLLYVCRKPCLNQIKYRHLNIIQHIIKVAFMDMVVFAVLSKTTSSIVKFNFKLICSCRSLYYHQWELYTVAPVYASPSETINELAFDRMIKSDKHIL